MWFIFALFCWIARAQDDSNEIIIALVTAETTNVSDSSVVRYPSAVQYRSAFLLAMADIHAYGLLLNYTLTPILVDTGQDAARMFTKVLNISTLHNLVGIVGPDFSPKVDIVSPIAVYRKIVLVSPSASSPVLSDKIKYPYFFRVVPPDTRQALAFIEMCLQFNWRSFATYSSNDIYGEYLLEALTREAQARGLIVLRSFSHVNHLDDPVQIKSHLEYLQKSDAKIFFFIGQSETAKVVEQVGKGLGLMGPGYAWIGSDAVDPTILGPGWLCVLPSGYGIRKNALQTRLLNLPVGDFPDRASCWLAGQECAMSPYVIVNETNIPLINPDPTFIDPFAPYYYQAVIAIAYALQHTLDAGEDIHEGDAVRKYLYNVSFQSFTSSGNFTFDHNGDPKDAGYAVFNSRTQGSPRQVATIEALDLTMEFLLPIYWMGGQRKPPTSGELESFLPLLWELVIVFAVCLGVLTFVMYAYRASNSNARVSVIYLHSIGLYDFLTDAVMVAAVVKTEIIVTTEEFQASVLFLVLTNSCHIVVFLFFLSVEFCRNPQFYTWFRRYLETAIPLLCFCVINIGNFRLLDSAMFSKARFKAPFSPALRRALPLLSFWTVSYSIVKIVTKGIYFSAFENRASVMVWASLVLSFFTLCFLLIYLDCFCCRELSNRYSNNRDHLFGGNEGLEMNRMNRQSRMSRITSQLPGNWTFKPWTPTLRAQLIVALKSRDLSLVTTLLENVSDVDLKYSRLFASDIEILAQAIATSRTLSFISLECNDIGEEGAEFLARGLKEQSISRSGILEYEADCWSSPTLTVIHVDRALRLGIKKASAGFTSAEELSVVISEVAAWAPHLILRLSVDLDVQFWLAWNGRRSLIAELAGFPSLKDLILRLEQAHPKIVFQNDDQGFSAYKSACPLVKEALDDVYQFCGRYELNLTPEHRSETCVVYRAVDLHDNVNVVIKFMKNESQFKRELLEREGLSSKFIVPVLKDSTSFQTRWAQDACSMIGLSDHPLGVVMPAAERNLMVVLLQERVDWGQVTHLITVVVQCLQHLHSNGRIHGDLKPLNIVRMFELDDENEEKNARRKSRMVKKTWRLIDFDAAVRIAQPVGVKTSTAYCPPELACGDGKAVQFRDPEKTKREDTLLAHPSFDMWSLGVILFRALAHQPLLEADDRDNLRGLQEFNKLLSWCPRSLDSALAQLDSILRVDRVQPRQRLAACDFMGWLLQRDPSNRPPTCDQMLTHSFLKGNEWLMSPLHVAAGLGDLATVRSLIQQQALLLFSIQHSTGKTALHVAAENGCIDVVMLLLDSNASPNARDGASNTPLHCVLHLLNQYEWFTAVLMPVCRFLGKCSELSLKEGSGVWTALELGLSSNNPDVRDFFEHEVGSKDIYRNAAIPVVSWSQIVCGQHLGSGICGAVRQCIWNGGDYAVKTMLTDSIAQEDDLKREIAINRHLSYHPHSSVVRMMGTTDSQPLAILMELYPLGSVFDYVVKGNNFRATSSLLTILINASAGLLHLHSLDVIHRDIAARNFLVKHDLSTAVCDFGLARRLPAGKNSGRTTVAERRVEKIPINISAPESLVSGDYSRKSDVFMFGLFIYEVLARQPPHFCNANLISRPPKPMEFVKELIAGLRPDIPSEWSPSIHQLLTRCWGSPAERPDMKDVNQALRLLRDGESPHGPSLTRTPSPSSFSSCAVPPSPSQSDESSHYFADYGLFYETCPQADDTSEEDTPTQILNFERLLSHVQLSCVQLPEPLMIVNTSEPEFYQEMSFGVTEEQKHGA